MKIQELKDKLRTAEITKDVLYAVSVVEDYCRANDIDLWRTARRIEDLVEHETSLDRLSVIMDLADAKNLHELEEFVVKSMHKNDLDIERVEELTQIKQELRRLYCSLLKSLT